MSLGSSAQMTPFAELVFQKQNQSVDQDEGERWWAMGTEKTSSGS